MFGKYTSANSMVVANDLSVIKDFGSRHTVIAVFYESEPEVIPLSESAPERSPSPTKLVQKKQVEPEHPPSATKSPSPLFEGPPSPKLQPRDKLPLLKKKVEQTNIAHHFPPKAFEDKSWYLLPENSTASSLSSHFSQTKKTFVVVFVNNENIEKCSLLILRADPNKSQEWFFTLNAGNTEHFAEKINLFFSALTHSKEQPRNIGNITNEEYNRRYVDLFLRASRELEEEFLKSFR
jgi:hypothetical protein